MMYLRHRCHNNSTLGVVTSETQTVFVGVTPKFLPQVDFVSSSDKEMHSPTAIPPISSAKQDKKCGWDSNLLVPLAVLQLICL
jgi:hypothetical protein